MALCICAYTAFAVDYQAGFSVNIFDKTKLPEGLFIVFAVSRLYVWMTSRKIFRVMTFTGGPDSHFSAAMVSMMRFAVIIFMTIAVKLLLVKFSGSPDLRALLTRGMGNLFVGGGRNISTRHVVECSAGCYHAWCLCTALSQDAK